MQKTVSKSELARIAGVNPATITRVAPKQFPNAFVGKKIDLSHPEVIAYLEMRAEKQDQEPAPAPAITQNQPKKVVNHAPVEGKNYTAIAKKYASDAVSGEIPACKWIILACKSFLDDLKSKDIPYYYDKNAAHRVCKFVELQRHTKGPWMREKKLLVLEPWQVFFIVNVFGWLKKKNGFRRYTEAFLMVPRKNGKSQLAAAIALYLLCADNEGAPEVYCGATTESQANEVFEPAKMMCKKNDLMVSHFGIDVRASNINIPGTGAKLERLIGNPGDGGSPSGAIVDEYHEHKTDALYSTMSTGTMARPQALILVTTTAGDNLASPCYAYQIESQKALEGSIKGIDARFSLMYGVDAGDDWASVEALKKANPNFGVSVIEDVVMATLENAKSVARKQSAYKTKHLNIWVGSRDAFYNIDRWASSSDPSIKIEDFYGRRAFIGMDLASKVDIAAIEVLIPLGDDRFARFGRYYLPEAALESTASEHYSTWMTEGWLTITDGNIIDFNEIKCDILDLCANFEVVEVGYDPFQATMLATELMSEGVPVVELGAIVKNFSEPMKQIDGLIRSKAIIHNGDPVMTWMLSNVVAKLDAKDNVYPRKERDENKIDGPVAQIMAMNRYMNDDAASLDDFLNNQISVNF